MHPLTVGALLPGTDLPSSFLTMEEGRGGGDGDTAFTLSLDWTGTDVASSAFWRMKGGRGGGDTVWLIGTDVTFWRMKGDGRGGWHLLWLMMHNDIAASFSLVRVFMVNSDIHTGVLLCCVISIATIHYTIILPIHYVINFILLSHQLWSLHLQDIKDPRDPKPLMMLLMT